MRLHTKNKKVVHTGAMRHGVWFLVLGVLAAALAAASARADGTGTNPGTTTGATTTTTAPTYAPLGRSYLPTTCVGAGAATIAEPGRPVLALGTPASSLGASGYPAGKAPLVAFGSSASSGSTCKTAHVSLESVSLLRGAVTATSVQATAGRGSVTGLEIDGSPAGLAAGQMTAIGNWAQLYLGKRVGRLAAPLVLVLLSPHDGLPASTTITVAFAASAEPAKPKAEQPSTTTTTPGGTTTTPAAGSQNNSHPGHAGKKHKKGKRKPVPQPLTVTPPLGFRPSHYVFPVATGADYSDTYGGVRNDIYDGWHHGDDLFAPLGTPIVAVANGKLSLVGWNRLGGWRLWLTDGDGNSFYYAHLAGYSRWVLKHPNVRAGQVVGFLGRTGDAFTTTPHLHFEIHPHQLLNLGYDGAVDPTAYLKKWRIVTVPKNEMPTPAKLKAPVGTPAQEAAVVWHELLVARHLLPVVTNTALNRPFPQPRSVEATGLKLASPLAGAAPAASHIAMSRSDAVPWLGASVFGAVVVLSLGGAGAFTVRRRRRTAEEPSS
jgi:murein DD-endopeptidase MepM/ murein hydrolase activator NlpD